MPIADSLYDALRTAALECPDKEFVRVSGESFTYGEALGLVERAARGLRALGLEPGDRVGLMTMNCPESIWTWLGSNAAGLIDVPFNAEARGRLLDYFVGDAAPRVLIGTEDYLTILADETGHSPDFVVRIGAGHTEPFAGRAKSLNFDELLAKGATSDLELSVTPDMTATIMYTSGTTGPSKGVMLPQRYYTAQAESAGLLLDVTQNDVFYCVQPLFHIDARAWVAAAVRVHSVIAVGSRFSVTGFWDEMRAHGATVFGTIGTMLWLLSKQPPRADDTDIPARLAVCSSTPGEILHDFEKRFGIQIVEAYGMTECLIIASAPASETQAGRIGQGVPMLDVQLVDDDDAPVEQGEVGEVVYRPLEQFMMMQGYWQKPADTVTAWRNLWFHTGDLAKQHDDGYLEFIGRKKDSIRRRGENVSAWEVETAVLAHPKVLEVAAIGVPSEVGEEDVAILVVAVPGQDIDPRDLVDFVSKDLPRFAVPRYVELVASLPKTPSERIEKGKVRERGITEAAWDSNLALGRR
jgi:crotonobetaine/carnitine-CoA ligase